MTAGMKKCPQCGQTYSDAAINFCLNDGELLIAADVERSPLDDDSPPTLMMDAARVTDQTNWGAGPLTQWTPQTPSSVQTPYNAPAAFGYAKDHTLPIVSLVLGILAAFLVCCYGGIWLGVPAAIVGYLGMKNADSDPGRYDGRGMAIAGMVLGVVTFLISMVFLIVAGLAN